MGLELGAVDGVTLSRTLLLWMYKEAMLYGKWGHLGEKIIG